MGVLKVGQRTVLAKTCVHCHKFKQASEFSYTSHTKGSSARYLMSWCMKCIARSPAAQAARKRKGARDQSESIETAEHWHEFWTGPELDLAEDLSMTSKEVARLTGRTVYGVRNMRVRLKRDGRESVERRAAEAAASASAPRPEAVRRAAATPEAVETCGTCWLVPPCEHTE